tara:strand:- start:2126 stop:2800 length:675 start_codon:yes stop_codon:yes gene_type:complete
MKKNTYYTLSFILVGVVLLGGRYLGYGFLERVISALVIGGLFELVYKKKLKKNGGEKYIKFEKFKESVKNILETKEDIYISITPYKWDTIEKQETYSDLYWEGIKYSGSWDSIVKNAVFHFDLEYESIKDFYEIIKTHKSLDELRGDDFNLIPVEDSGAHRENIKINWERPLTKPELEAFEEYGGVEKLVWEIDDYDNEDVIVGRISSIEISVGDREIIIGNFS